MDKQKILKDVKTLIGIDDDLQDDVLNVLIDGTINHLTIMLDINELPNELDFIVKDVTVKRYNRLGSEGYQYERVENHSINYSELDDFEPYKKILERYMEKSDGEGELILI